MPIPRAIAVPATITALMRPGWTNNRWATEIERKAHGGLGRLLTQGLQVVRRNPAIIAALLDVAPTIAASRYLDDLISAKAVDTLILGRWPGPHVDVSGGDSRGRKSGARDAKHECHANCCRGSRSKNAHSHLLMVKVFLTLNTQKALPRMNRV
jgi:hypothetical protein